MEESANKELQIIIYNYCNKELHIIIDNYCNKELKIIIDTGPCSTKTQKLNQESSNCEIWNCSYDKVQKTLYEID